MGSISKPSSEVSSALELQDRLDSLWTTYLQHLHEYTEAQKSIQKYMSAGFLSLARANFNARDGVRRFGKDFYHEKAIASRWAWVSSAQDTDRLQLSVIEFKDGEPDVVTDSLGENVEEKLPAEDKANQRPSPSSSSADEHLDSNDDASEKPDEKDSKTAFADSKARSNLPMDPLRWFGVLVPPALRSAQSSFVTVIEEPVSSAVNSARAMREVEYEIRKLRKEIKKAGQSHRK